MVVVSNVHILLSPEPWDFWPFYLVREDGIRFLSSRLFFFLFVTLRIHFHLPWTETDRLTHIILSPHISADHFHSCLLSFSWFFLRSVPFARYTSPVSGPTTTCYCYCYLPSLTCHDRTGLPMCSFPGVCR